MLTKEEFLKKIGKTEEDMEKDGMEVVAYDDGFPDSEGWEVRYKD